MQRKGRELGIDVTFVDMKFGVKDDNTKDHLTWIACSEQIKYCFDQSDGIFFISLQGYKYGYMPIPKYLQQLGIDDKIKIDQWSEEDSKIFNNWYKLDENSIPPQYTLKNLNDISDKSYWDIALPKLRAKLEGIQFDKESSEDIEVFRSVTEWEVKQAIKLDINRCYWLRRQFSASFCDWNFCDFSDSSNDSTRIKYENLIFEMKTQFNSNSQYDLIAIPNLILDAFKEKEKSPYYNEYFTKWNEKLCEKLNNELERIIAKIKSWKEEGIGIPTSLGDDLSEIVHHIKLAEEKLCRFFGRETLLEQAISYIENGASHNNTTEKKRNKHKIKIKKSLSMDISLSIIGLSGSGKTSFMSKLVKISSQNSPSIPVVIRFCGTSKESLTGLSFVRSISFQIQLLYGLAANESVPLDYPSAVQFLHNLLLKYPIKLFIDSLDQLTDKDFARSKLSFLINVKCHKNGRLIVSTLPDEINKVSITNRKKYVYLCEAELKKFQIKILNIPLFQIGENFEVKTMLIKLLYEYKRTLTDEQISYTLQKLFEEPSILYLTLALNIIKKWRSSWKISSNNCEVNINLANRSISIDTCELIGTVNGVINQIFDNLERDFGFHVTRFAIGFITFARMGKTNN